MLFFQRNRCNYDHRCLESRCCHRISLSLFFLSFVFLPFVCLVDVRYWQYRLRARLSSAATATSQALGAFEASLRREGSYLDSGHYHPRPGRQLIRSSRVKDGIAKQADERSRHAGRYWRFVQVLRRPGRRRLQKHNHRRPDTDYQPERFRIHEEGF